MVTALNIMTMAKAGREWGLWDLSDDKSVQEAFELIKRSNGIQAVPIYRLEPQTTKVYSKSYYALLSSADLIRFILGRLHIDSVEIIGAMRVSEIKIPRDCRTTGVDSALNEIVEAFVHDPLGLMVVNKDSYGFMAPVDLMRYVSENHLIGTIKVEYSKVDRKMLIGSEESAFVAFSKMVEYGYNALGVIDSNGALIHNVSISDFYTKGISLEEILREINLPVLQFLKRIQKDVSLEVYQSHESYGVNDCLKKMLRLHIHQLWMVDNNGQPKTTISFNDVLDAITRAQSA